MVGAMTEELKNKAKELLKSGQVDVIIGYQRAPDRVSAAPCLIDNEQEVDRLIWDAYCVYNLANYLKFFKKNEIKIKKEDKTSGSPKESLQMKIGIVAKPCDVKSIVVLLQENQVRREELFIIGLNCKGVIGASGTAEKCKACNIKEPAICDYLIKDNEKDARAPEEKDAYEHIRKFEAKSGDERFKFWQEEFSQCIRCYACRQVCPMCYCPKCVADQAQPAWFSKANSFEGNFSWNVTRAMHLAGRCIDCGECERACPVGIPLRDINKKIERDIKELFNYEAGQSSEQKPLLSSFDKNDPGDFIK